jgi:hypothetical protein
LAARRSVFGRSLPVLAAPIYGAGGGNGFFSPPQIVSVFIVMDNYRILSTIGTRFAARDRALDCFAL